MRIRTYPHICIPAAKDFIHGMPSLDVLQQAEEAMQDEPVERDEERPPARPDSSRRGCESNCWASSAMSVVLESLKDALPQMTQDSVSATAAAGPQVINRGMFT